MLRVTLAGGNEGAAFLNAVRYHTNANGWGAVSINRTVLARGGVTRVYIAISSLW